MMSKINNLSIEDIHNIRYENYEDTKNLSFRELIRQTSQKAQAFKNGLFKYASKQAENVISNQIITN
jgi:hypothetical protein